MTDEPTVETLFRQASMTAHTYFHEAMDYIDKRFDKGYAEAHPELIGLFMQTAALDFQAGIISGELQRIATALESVASELDDLGQ